MHVIASAAQLNAFSTVGGGDVGLVWGVGVGVGVGGNSGRAWGAEGSVGSSCDKEAALPPPQPAREAIKNRFGNHLRQSIGTRVLCIIVRSQKGHVLFVERFSEGKLMTFTTDKFGIEAV